MQNEVNKMSSNTGGNMNNHLHQAKELDAESDSEDDLGCDIDVGVVHNLIF